MNDDERKKERIFKSYINQHQNRQREITESKYYFKIGFLTLITILTVSLLLKLYNMHQFTEYGKFANGIVVDVTLIDHIDNGFERYLTSYYSLRYRYIYNGKEYTNFEEIRTSDLDIEKIEKGDTIKIELSSKNPGLSKIVLKQ